MPYVIYQITNLCNSKIYVGVHKVVDPSIDDGYMGSSKYLKNAIKKYGMDNFKKDILHTFDVEGLAYAKEAELVTEEFVQRKDTYNVKPGGYGNSHYGRTVVERGVGIHAWTFEQRSVYQKERVANTDPVKIKEIASLGGKIGGAKNKEMGLGFCGASKEQQIEYAKIGLAAAKKMGLGFFNSKTQSELGKRGGPKNKGFRWYNDGVKSYKYTKRNQDIISFEEFISAKPIFSKGRVPGSVKGGRPLGSKNKSSLI